MKPLHRSYKMTDPALTLKCEDVLDSIDRDIAEFNARGFTPAKRTLFLNTITAFDAMPSDNYLLGLQEIATQTKNETRVLCETAVNAVLTAVVNVWGIDSAQYHFFTEDKSLSNLTDTELLRFLEDFADATEDELTALLDEGIDAATVTNLRALRVSYNTALKNQRKAIKTRDTGDHARIKKGNELNKLLVTHCNTGKNIWLNIDESKYNDYVIYDTPTGGSGINIVREAELAGAMPVNIPIADVIFTSHTRGLIEVTNNAQQAYAGATPAALYNMGDPLLDLAIGNDDLSPAEFAAATGLGTTGDFLMVRLVGVGPGHIKITFTNVAE